jgi:hypothetical protein
MTSAPIPIHPERMTAVKASISSAPKLGRPNAKKSARMLGLWVISRLSLAKRFN